MILPFSPILAEVVPAAVVEPVRLEYEAHAGCPDASRFVGEVLGRTDRARSATSTEQSRIFAVTVAREGNQSHAWLRITALDGSETRREVTSEDCNEAVSAIALIAALAIDPEASSEIKAPPSTPVSTRAPAPRVGSGPADGAPAEPANAEPAPVPTDAQRKDAEADRASDVLVFEWSFGAAGIGLGGLVPSWALGGGAYVASAPTHARAFVPSFRVSAFVTTTDTSFNAPLGATITWFFSRVEVCPLRPPLTSDFVFQLCGALDMGAMRVAGTGLSESNTTMNPWFAIGGGPELAWRSSERVELEFGTTLMAPLRRYPFDYDDSARGTLEAFEMRPVALTLTLGAGYRFP